MANWVSNQLTITGKVEDLRKARGTLVKGWESEWCDSEPENIADLFDQLSNDLDKEAKIDIRFRTRWDPPIDLIKKIGIIFPKLAFSLKFEDPLGYFAGSASVKADQYTENKLEGEALKKHFAVIDNADHL